MNPPVFAPFLFHFPQLLASYGVLLWSHRREVQAAAATSAYSYTCRRVCHNPQTHESALRHSICAGTATLTAAVFLAIEVLLPAYSLVSALSWVLTACRALALACRRWLPAHEPAGPAPTSPARTPPSPDPVNSRRTQRQPSPAAIPTAPAPASSPGADSAKLSSPGGVTSTAATSTAAAGTASHTSPTPASVPASSRSSVPSSAEVSTSDDGISSASPSDNSPAPATASPAGCFAGQRNLSLPLATDSLTPGAAAAPGPAGGIPSGSMSAAAGSSVTPDPAHPSSAAASASTNTCPTTSTSLRRSSNTEASPSLASPPSASTNRSIPPPYDTSASPANPSLATSSAIYPALAGSHGSPGLTTAAATPPLASAGASGSSAAAAPAANPVAAQPSASTAGIPTALASNSSTFLPPDPANTSEPTDLPIVGPSTGARPSYAGIASSTTGLPDPADPAGTSNAAAPVYDAGASTSIAHHTNAACTTIYTPAPPFYGEIVQHGEKWKIGFEIGGLHRELSLLSKPEAELALDMLAVVEAPDGLPYALRRPYGPPSYDWVRSARLDMPRASVDLWHGEVLMSFSIAAAIAAGVPSIKLEDCPLALAIIVSKHVNPRLVRLLLAAAPSLACHTYRDGGTSLHYVVDWTSDSDSRLGLLLRAAQHLVRRRNAAGRMPLHVAVGCGKLAAVHLLLAAAPETATATDGTGRTPLHMAAECWEPQRQLEIISLLLEAAPETATVPDNYGHLPVYYAVMGNGSRPAIALLLEAAPGASVPYYGSLLHKAINHGSFSAVPEILRAVPSSAALTDSQGRTALQLALSGEPALLEECAPAIRCLLAASSTPSVLLAVASAGVHAQPFFADCAIVRPALTAAEWAMLPSPCPGLGRALPAVLARSQLEACFLVERLPAADRAQLRSAALCLTHARASNGAALPGPVAERILALSLSA